MELSEEEINFLSRKLDETWYSLPAPKRGISALDIATYMLESPGYSFSPKVEEWPGATHLHFQRLWMSLSRLAGYEIFGKRLEILMSGRNCSGYTRHHKLPSFTSDKRREVSRASEHPILLGLIPQRSEMEYSHGIEEDYVLQSTNFEDRRIYRTIEGIVLEESVDSAS